MERLYCGFTLDIPPGCFPLSTDSMLLAHFARQAGPARVLDLGSGCGTLGILLCGGDEACHVTGLELEESAHRAALANIQANGLTGRMESICADLRTVSSLFPAGSFRCCVSNPPYFSGGAASARHGSARRDDQCSAQELFRAAAWVLPTGGDFFLVHRPEKLAQLIACGAEVSLEAKQLMLIRHRPDAPVSLILLRFRRGGKPGLRLHEGTLLDAQGLPTPFYREVYHMPDP